MDKKSYDLMTAILTDFDSEEWEEYRTQKPWPTTDTDRKPFRSFTVDELKQRVTQYERVVPTAPGFSIGADAASRVNTTPKRSVNPGVAVNLAAYSSCRQLLEQFAENFVEQHEEFHSSGLCICELSPKSTKTAIFKHFEQCRAVTKDSDTLLGDELTLALRSVMLNDTAVRPPTTGNFANLYGSLSTGIHSCNWFRDDMGAVVVPNDLDPSTKRFLIRALLALQEQVVVADSFGSVRLPLPDEINSPDRAKKARKT